MQANYPQPDGRSIARRKRSANKLCGALVLFADRVLKALIRHGFAAWYEVRGNGPEPSQVLFLNRLGPTPSFLLCLGRVLEIVARSCGVGFLAADGLVALAGHYVLKHRYGPRDARPVASTFVLVGPPV